MVNLRNENDWRVNKAGDIDNEASCYGIEHWRLSHPWLSQLAGKNWVDIFAFREAYVTACRRAGVREVQLDYYPGTMVSVDDLADLTKFVDIITSSPEISSKLNRR